ncbi:hypothetical protein H9P43_007264 [Blastocladiella emersonii ATCC 22665]|nr:hypothetical protein H9P43_007264 [Blastocladiella emersonii ATCC 22665]
MQRRDIFARARPPRADEAAAQVVTPATTHAPTATNPSARPHPASSPLPLLSVFLGIALAQENSPTMDFGAATDSADRSTSTIRTHPGDSTVSTAGSRGASLATDDDRTLNTQECAVILEAAAAARIRDAAADTAASRIDPSPVFDLNLSRPDPTQRRGGIRSLDPPGLIAPSLGGTPGAYSQDTTGIVSQSFAMDVVPTQHFPPATNDIWPPPTPASVPVSAAPRFAPALGACPEEPSSLTPPPEEVLDERAAAASRGPAQPPLGPPPLHQPAVSSRVGVGGRPPARGPPQPIPADIHDGATQVLPPPQGPEYQARPAGVAAAAVAPDLPPDIHDGPTQVLPSSQSQQQQQPAYPPPHSHATITSRVGVAGRPAARAPPKPIPEGIHDGPTQVLPTSQEPELDIPLGGAASAAGTIYSPPLPGIHDGPTQVLPSSQSQQPYPPPHPHATITSRVGVAGRPRAQAPPRPIPEGIHDGPTQVLPSSQSQLPELDIPAGGAAASAMYSPLPPPGIHDGPTQVLPPSQTQHSAPGYGSFLAAAAARTPDDVPLSMPVFDDPSQSQLASQQTQTQTQLQPPIPSPSQLMVTDEPPPSWLLPADFVSGGSANMHSSGPGSSNGSATQFQEYARMRHVVIEAAPSLDRVASSERMPPPPPPRPRRPAEVVEVPPTPLDAANDDEDDDGGVADGAPARVPPRSPHPQDTTEPDMFKDLVGISTILDDGAAGNSVVDDSEHSTMIFAGHTPAAEHDDDSQLGFAAVFPQPAPPAPPVPAAPPVVAPPPVPAPATVATPAPAAISQPPSLPRSQSLPLPPALVPPSIRSLRAPTHPHSGPPSSCSPTLTSTPPFSSLPSSASKPTPPALHALPPARSPAPPAPTASPPPPAAPAVPAAPSAHGESQPRELALDDGGADDAMDVDARVEPEALPADVDPDTRSGGGDTSFVQLGDSFLGGSPLAPADTSFPSTPKQGSPVLRTQRDYLHTRMRDLPEPHAVPPELPSSRRRISPSPIRGTRHSHSHHPASGPRGFAGLAMSPILNADRTIDSEPAAVGDVSATHDATDSMLLDALDQSESQQLDAELGAAEVNTQHAIVLRLELSPARPTAPAPVVTAPAPAAAEVDGCDLSDEIAPPLPFSKRLQPQGTDARVEGPSKRRRKVIDSPPSPASDAEGEAPAAAVAHPLSVAEAGAADTSLASVSSLSNLSDTQDAGAAALSRLPVPPSRKRGAKPARSAAAGGDDDDSEDELIQTAVKRRATGPASKHATTTKRRGGAIVPLAQAAPEPEPEPPVVATAPPAAPRAPRPRTRVASAPIVPASAPTLPVPPSRPRAKTDETVPTVRKLSSRVPPRRSRPTSFRDPNDSDSSESDEADDPNDPDYATQSVPDVFERTPSPSPPPSDHERAATPPRALSPSPQRPAPRRRTGSEIVVVVETRAPLPRPTAAPPAEDGSPTESRRLKRGARERRATDAGEPSEESPAKRAKRDTPATTPAPTKTAATTTASRRGTRRNTATAPSTPTKSRSPARDANDVPTPVASRLRRKSSAHPGSDAGGAPAAAGALDRLDSIASAGSTTRAIPRGAPAIPGAYAVGDLVWARWTDSEHYYPARVQQRRAATSSSSSAWYYVLFFDGDKLRCPHTDLRPYGTLRKGQKVWTYNGDELIEAHVADVPDDEDDEYVLDVHGGSRPRHVGIDSVLLTAQLMKEIDRGRRTASTSSSAASSARKNSARTPAAQQRQQQHVEAMDVDADGDTQPLSPSEKMDSDDDDAGPASVPAIRRRPTTELFTPAPTRHADTGDVDVPIPTLASPTPAENHALTSARPTPVRTSPRKAMLPFQSPMVGSTSASAAGLFAGMSFVVTLIHADEGDEPAPDSLDPDEIPLPPKTSQNNPHFDRGIISALIVQNGGRVLDSFRGVEPATDMVKSTVFCIASGPKRSIKYLMALALGVPRISCQWVLDCVSQRSAISPFRYGLPNGFSLELQCQLSTVYCPRFFAGRTFQVQGDADYRQGWTGTLQAAGANVVSSKAKCDYILCMNARSSAARKTSGAGTSGSANGPRPTSVTTEWAIQCLINQRIVDPMRLAKYHY